MVETFQKVLEEKGKKKKSYMSYVKDYVPGASYFLPGEEDLYGSGGEEDETEDWEVIDVDTSRMEFKIYAECDKDIKEVRDM